MERDRARHPLQGRGPAGLDPHFDRQFTATAAMLETVESAFADLHERYEEVRGYWDMEGEGARS